MKKYALLLLLIFSCKKEEILNIPKEVQDSSVVNNQKENVLSDEEILKLQKKEEAKMSEIVRKYTLQKSGDGFDYKVFCEEQKNGMINFRKINILKSGKLIQQLKVDKDSTYIYHDYEVDFSCNEDWNFDGFKDFKLIQRVGMIDQQYYLWIFDNVSGRYKFSPSFVKIMNPVLDKNKKEITSSYHIGPTDFYYEIYKWKNNKYVMTYQKGGESEP